MTGKAFGYARASTKEEVEQGSIDRQIQTIERYCRENNLELKKFEDKAISGKTGDRPKLKEMLRLIPIEKPDIVLFTKIDRLARSTRDLLEIVNYLEKNNVKMLALEQPEINTTTSAGKLMLQILGAIAEFEVNIINERTKAGREYARAKGVKFGRPKNKTSKKNGAVFIDEKKVIQLYTVNMMSARSIAKLMKCSHTMIIRILKENGIEIRKGSREAAAPREGYNPGGR